MLLADSHWQKAEWLEPSFLYSDVFFPLTVSFISATLKQRDLGGRSLLPLPLLPHKAQTLRLPKEYLDWEEYTLWGGDAQSNDTAEYSFPIALCCLYTGFKNTSIQSETSYSIVWHLSWHTVGLLTPVLPTVWLLHAPLVPSSGTTVFMMVTDTRQQLQVWLLAILLFCHQYFNFLIIITKYPARQPKDRQVYFGS